MNKKEILNRYSNEDEKILMAKVMDKIEFTINRNTIENTDFLDLYQKELVKDLLRNIEFSNYTFWGGSETAEREILILYPEKLEGILKKEDVAEKLLSIVNVNLPNELKGEYNHRDYLGAILNLGIDRSKIGDIFIGENVAYIYVITGISDYIINNFTKVKHTHISCKIAYDEIENVRPNLKEIKGTIGNIRLDSIISLAFNKSRSSIVSYIEEKKVFVNGKIITSNGYSIKENDIISVRGLGRVIYNRQISVTKKGKNLVSVSIYC